MFLGVVPRISPLFRDGSTQGSCTTVAWVPLRAFTPGEKTIHVLFSLLGDIGGQMGLFIGASILTILELFDYIYEVRPLPFALFLQRSVGLPDMVPGWGGCGPGTSMPTWIINFN